MILVDCLTRRTKIANEAMDRLALPPMNRTFRDIGWRIVYCHPIRKEVPLERAIEVERNGFHSVLGVCWPHGSESLELMAHRAVKGCKEVRDSLPHAANGALCVYHSATRDLPGLPCVQLSQQIRNGEDLAYDDPPVWPVVVAHKLDSEVATVARMMDVGYITSVTGDMQGVTREKMEASRRRWVILACARAAALGALGLAGAAVMRHLNGSFWLGFAGAVMASLLKIILEMFAPKFEPAWKSQLVALSGFAIVLVYGSSPWGFSNVKALLLEIFHVLILSVAQHPLDKLLRWRAAVE